MLRDQCGLIFLQFRYLHNRLLLHRQDELRVLEQQLDELDRVADPSHKCLRSREYDDKHSGQRSVLFDDIEKKSTSYANLVGVLQNFAAIQLPTKGDLRSFYYFFCNENPLVDPEVFYRHREDLMTLKPQGDTTWIDHWLMSILNNQAIKPLREGICDTLRHGDAQHGIVYHDPTKVGFIKATVMFLVLLVLLTAPIYPLYQLGKQETTPLVLAETILTQFASSLLFAVFLKLFTTAKRHEPFTASVTYMAIWVVFMSQSQ
ncbi:Uu.00g115050.m01.CDS01 [Anthostomella pinea]|uniref:Uu.00g115050.m01.CDS01 n=1 Tax=Anthostomella pinea TaxID=933095 RepID=A0AAI8YGQ4_9PEZI|nr:Uu.00g115050.m01.CDS01 [Anthostomella pinea]